MEAVDRQHLPTRVLVGAAVEHTGIADEKAPLPSAVAVQAVDAVGKPLPALVAVGGAGLGDQLAMDVRTCGQQLQAAV